MSVDVLQTLLQNHLASELSAVTYLPLILSSLSTQALETSPHLSKWNSRVNSLIHSKDAGVRWAGISIALQASRLSRSILLSSAQGWITVVLPLLSRTEILPVWKAVIRLVAFIATSTTHLLEFQRQVVTPNVPKFSLALVSLVEKQNDLELKILALDVLTALVKSFPTLHRPLHASLSALTLRALDGSSAAPTPRSLIKRACNLNAHLHATGGKVGGSALWRKSVDETVAFTLSSLTPLRSTLSNEAHRMAIDQANEDPLIVIALALDRLRCGVELLCTLLFVSTSRPVTIPVESIVNLCLELLQDTYWNEISSEFDSSRISMEAAVHPRVLELGCQLLGRLVLSVRQRLAPHLTRILSAVTYHLEQNMPASQRLPFIKLIPDLFSASYPATEPLLVGRLVKALLPSLSVLLLQGKAESDGSAPTVNGGKRGKKRARGYEGDEALSGNKEVLCSADEGVAILAALDALPHLLRTPDLPQYVQSLSSRLLLSLLLTLPELPSSSISTDPTFRDLVSQKVKDICVELAVSSSVVLSNSLPLILEPVSVEGRSVPSNSSRHDINRVMTDLMLHPRLPPILRALPSLDTIALSRAEESLEETKARETMGLTGGVLADEHDSPTPQALAMTADIATARATVAIPIPPSNQAQATAPDAEVAPQPSSQTEVEIVSTVIETTASFAELQGDAISEAKAEKPLVSLGSEVVDDPTREDYSAIASEPTIALHVPDGDLKSGGEKLQPRAAAPATADPAYGMAIDGNDSDDENFDMPAINLESDTESES